MRRRRPKGSWHRDPVTPEVRREVLNRDAYVCAARALDPTSDACRDRWGSTHPLRVRAELQLDHVRDEPGGHRAPSDPAHLVTVCPHHHLNGWATSHRPLLREYLARADKAWARHLLAELYRDHQ